MHAPRPAGVTQVSLTRFKVNTQRCGTQPGRSESRITPITSSRMAAVLYCISISILYVASLYVWAVPGHRNHPVTVRARMLSVLLTCCVAWLPAWHMRRKVCVTAHSLARCRAVPNGSTDCGPLPAAAFFPCSWLMIMNVIQSLQQTCQSCCSCWACHLQARGSCSPTLPKRPH